MTSLNKDCPICKNTINAHSNVVTPCNHKFCTECFFKWIKHGKSCPMCRKVFIISETEETRQELIEINNQIDIDYSIMNSLRSENNYLEEQIDNKKYELNIYKEKLQRLQRYIDYKRDWLDLYNIKIKSHNIKIKSHNIKIQSRNIKSRIQSKRNWMQHNK